MPRSIPLPRIPASRGKRYSLRMLFLVSAVIAVPFLLLANLRHSVRPDESVASPLYLLLGIAAVVLAAALGSALGSRASMIASAAVAAISWIALVVMCGLFSKELAAMLPVHGFLAVATVAALAVVAWTVKIPEQEGSHPMLLQLLQVKRGVREAQQAKNLDSNAAESPIQADTGGSKSESQPGNHHAR